MSQDSMLRHGSFTFDLQGISRAASHQIVRHRIASFSQQSQRYVKVTRSYGYLRPPGVPEDLRVPVEIRGHKLDLNFEDVMDLTRQAEEGLVAKGIKEEDSRYLKKRVSIVDDLVRKVEDGFFRTPPGELFEMELQPMLELVHPVETFVRRY